MGKNEEFKPDFLKILVEKQERLQKIDRASPEELEKIIAGLDAEEIKGLAGDIQIYLVRAYKDGWKKRARPIIKAMKRHYLPKKLDNTSKLTLEDVLRHPLKNSRGVFWEWCDEFRTFIDYKNREAGAVKRRLSKAAYLTGALYAFGLSALPHELIHAGVNKVTGGVNKEIVLNKFFGGSFWAEIIPGVEAKWLVPIIGGYVNIEPADRLASILTSAAPYVLTPVGITLFYSGIKKKNSVLFTLGAGITGAHASGVIGDFWNIGKDIYYGGFEAASQMFGNQPMSDDAKLWLALPVAIFGFFLGNGIMSYSYNLMKGAYNSLRNKFFKPELTV